MNTCHEIDSEHLKCWPYVRGHYQRDTLYQIWSLIEQAGDWDKIFWENQPGDTPISIKGDLTAWVQFVEDPIDKKILLIMVSRSDNQIAGIVWFNHVKNNEAYGCIWMRPEYRGAASREAVHLGLEHAFYAMGWTKVWAATPWPRARNLIKKSGFSDVVTLPGMHKVGDKPGNVFILAVEEQDYGQIKRPEFKPWPVGENASQNP